MTPSNGRSAMPPRTYTKEELRNVAQLSGLLEKKDTLLAELTAMNNQAEKMVSERWEEKKKQNKTKQKNKEKERKN